MSKFPWKTTLAVSALLAATVYAFAQASSGSRMGPLGQMQQGDIVSQMHSQMMQGQGGMGWRHEWQDGNARRYGRGGMHGQQSDVIGTPTIPGQDAFGAIQEVVQILQSDPKTDWSKVNIDALRQHLIDMNEVTLRAVATPRVFDDGSGVHGDRRRPHSGGHQTHGSQRT